MGWCSALSTNQTRTALMLPFGNRCVDICVAFSHKVVPVMQEARKVRLWDPIKLVTTIAVLVTSHKRNRPGCRFLATVRHVEPRPWNNVSGASYSEI
jgi:hypothetical protein